MYSYAHIETNSLLPSRADWVTNREDQTGSKMFLNKRYDSIHNSLEPVPLNKKKILSIDLRGAGNQWLKSVPVHRPKWHVVLRL